MGFYPGAVHRSAVTGEVLQSVPGEMPADERVRRWAEANSGSISRTLNTLAQLAEEGPSDLATLSVVLRQIRTVVRASAASPVGPAGSRPVPEVRPSGVPGAGPRAVRDDDAPEVPMVSSRILHPMVPRPKLKHKISRYTRVAAAPQSMFRAAPGARGAAKSAAPAWLWQHSRRGRRR